jgi:sugar phosphate permease
LPLLFENMGDQKVGLFFMIASGTMIIGRFSIAHFFYGAFDIGVISAGVSIGFLADLFGLRGMFMIAAGIGFTAALFFMPTIQSQIGRSVRRTLIGK